MIATGRKAQVGVGERDVTTFQGLDSKWHGMVPNMAQKHVHQEEEDGTVSCGHHAGTCVCACVWHCGCLCLCVCQCQWWARTPTLSCITLKR